jgi:hypothetical protein
MFAAPAEHGGGNGVVRSKRPVASRRPANKHRDGGLNMADKRGLGIMGFLFGGVTFAVTVIAFVVVRGHIDGQLQFDEVAMAPQLVSISTQ